jgi:energy-coupling factor transporter ATP-binding protein EcfA2
MKIAKISMVGFRGATVPVEISFDTTKTVALIFGENGTGKSTIADAFDFLCNRNYGSLENYHFGESPKKYVASFKMTASAVKITLSSDSSTWVASFGKDGPLVTPDTGCPDARILRRKAILKLIDARPKDRFEELKTFIAIPNIEKSEEALREAFKTAQKSFDESTRGYSQAKDGLDHLWIEENKPGTDALAWAGLEASKDITKLQSQGKELEKLESEFALADTCLGSLDYARKAQKESETSLKDAEEKLKTAESQQAQQNAELVSLLEEARAYIEKRQTLTQCPVCEQQITPADLVRRLKDRIKEMQEIKVLVEKVSTAKAAVHAKSSVVDQNQKDVCEKLKALALHLKACTLGEVTSLSVKWEDFAELCSAVGHSESIEIQARQLWQVIVPCRKLLQARKEIDHKSISQHNAIKGYFKTMKEKHAQATSLETLLKKLKAILDIVSKERKDYVEGILKSISGEVERLYTTLHPGEDIGKVTFYLKPNTIGSLEFDAQFHDASNLPPQAYYSESHLDTLGICVFLALAKYFRTDKTIVILDDVLTSIDSPHLARFMKILHDEASHYSQFFVTTHYRPWRDLYRWARGPTANTQLIELGPWTLEQGLNVGEFKTAISELRDILSKGPFDRQIAASKAGIILESLLDFVTVKFRCRVPRNTRNEYTLGELAQGIDSKLGKELRSRKPPAKGAAKVDSALEPLIHATTETNWVRNAVGCHFTTLGSEVSDVEVKTFCNEVLALSDNLICLSCQRLPTRRPSGSYWQCSCGELELYPLIYPGADLGTADDEG